MKKQLQIFIRWLQVPALCILLGACAAFGPEVVDHSFGFDMLQDGQDAVVLDYRYGNSKLPVQAPADAVRNGTPLTFNGVSGPMLRGEFLYVKWRNRNTGQVYEDTVDLRHRLPRDIARHKVYFMIRGPQLYVYLIPPEGKKREKNDPPIGPSMYDDLKTVQIYPDRVKP